MYSANVVSEFGTSNCNVRQLIFTRRSSPDVSTSHELILVQQPIGFRPLEIDIWRPLNEYNRRLVRVYVSGPGCDGTCLLYKVVDRFRA